MDKPRLDQGPDYERGFIDGMMYQTQSSVDKAVNRMAQEKTLQALHSENERLGLYKEALAHPEQEPVNINCPSCLHSFAVLPVAQREWVGLTDEELSILGESFTHPDEGIDEVDFGMEIQRILKEKNT